MNIFEECRVALNDQLSVISQNEENELLDRMYKYPFRFGNIDLKSTMVTVISLDDLIEGTINHIYSSEIFVIPDIEGIPIFKTNLFLILDNFDEVSLFQPKYLSLMKNIWLKLHHLMSY